MHEFENIKLIVTDEILMCGSKLFLFINLQEIMGISKLFGGISMIIIGDLFQLRPVTDRWIFEDPSTDSIELLSIKARTEFSSFELDENSRQKDLRFSLLLNRIREGKPNESDINFLNTRSITSVDEN